MFSLASSAASHAALTAKKGPPPIPRRKSTEGRRSSSSSIKARRATDKPTVNEVLGIKSCFKRSDTAPTLITEPSESDVSISENTGVSLRKEVSVSFSNVSIREFIVQLGDSPFSEGPPLCLSNERQDEVEIDVTKFDDIRSTSRRGSAKHFRLSAPERSRILLGLGYSMNDIADATVINNENRRELYLSLQNKKWDSFNAYKESAARTMKKIFLFGDKPTLEESKSKQSTRSRRFSNPDVPVATISVPSPSNSPRSTEAKTVPTP